jgi:hypothetical protein
VSWFNNQKKKHCYSSEDISSTDDYNEIIDRLNVEDVLFKKLSMMIV